MEMLTTTSWWHNQQCSHARINCVNRVYLGRCQIFMPVWFRMKSVSLVCLNLPLHQNTNNDNFLLYHFLTRFQRESSSNAPVYLQYTIFGALTTRGPSKFGGLFGAILGKEQKWGLLKGLVLILNASTLAQSGQSWTVPAWWLTTPITLEFGVTDIQVRDCPEAGWTWSNKSSFI